MSGFPTPTWFVGCGNMGQALVAGWKAAGIDLDQCVAIRPSGTPVDGVRTVRTLAEAGAPPRLVVLAVKPQTLDSVAADLRRWLTSKTVVLSILAGVETDSLRQRFPGAGAIVRAMPNLPVAIRRGVTGLFADDLDAEARERIGALFSAIGFAMWMADEQRLAALGAIAGAGPAYAARFVRALARAGESRGLSAEIAATIALETVLGTAWMAATEGEAMDEVVRRVASPNGTTQAGLAVLDQALDDLVAVTVEAAAQRGAELAEAARGADAPAAS